MLELSNAAVRTALSFIERAELAHDYKRLPMAEKYLRLMNMANDTMQDDLLRKDYGAQNLLECYAYFMHKHNHFHTGGK
jgi:hypothetical protein